MSVPQTPGEMLIDLLDDNQRRLVRTVQDADPAMLYWSPDGEANSIGVTIWHMGRLFDVYLVELIAGEPAIDECWFRYGWAEKTGYDPRGIGRDGWGSINGYTPEDIAAIPRLPVADLLAYLDNVYTMVRTYLKTASVSDLAQPGPGFKGKYSKYQLIQMVLLDNVRHMGEILAIQAMWNRQHPPAAS
jgi:hypothetical protein